MHDATLFRMNTDVTQAIPPSAQAEIAAPNRGNSPGLGELAFLLVGVLAMYVPTYLVLESTIWSIVGQGHGPVMLALTLWLAWQRWPDLMKLPDARPAKVKIFGLLLMLVGLFFYVIGRSQDILMLDVGSQIPLFAGMFLFYKGFAGLRKMWFPLFFFIFMIPMPSPVVDALTGPLKSAVSHVAENLMYWAGFPIGRAGVTLTIGPYQLLVADACAGLNSIFALEAIGVFYMSIVQHASKFRNVLLAVLILPISFVSNVIRVILLVLVTYYFGDEAGQGFVHDFAGIVLFMVATCLTIAVDSLLGLFFRSNPVKQDAT